MNALRTTLLTTLMMIGLTGPAFFAAPPLVGTATAGPIDVCVTDPFNFSLSEGECGEDKAWAQVGWNRTGLVVCVNTRFDDSDFPFCDDYQHAPSGGVACPGESQAPLAAFESRQVFSSGFRTTTTFAAYNVLPGETVTVTHAPTGDPMLDTTPNYVRLLHMDATGSCSLASTGDTDDGYLSYFNTVSFVMVGDPETTLGGTFFLQHRSWDLQAPLKFTAGRDAFN